MDDHGHQHHKQRQNAPPGATDRQLQQTYLRTLNETVSTATRRVFQTQLLHSQSSLCAIREHVPELCAFVDSLFQVPDVERRSASQTSGSRIAVAQRKQRHAATVRRVFRDPAAQWLTRSAVESGVTALMCGQLIRCAEERFAAKRDASSAKLAILLLCDQLLVPCSLRFGRSSRSCEWRDRKPSYHAMPCFSTWDTLLLFLERMVRRFPQVLMQVLDEYAIETQDGVQRVNCTFAQVVGLWRLMEALSGAQGSSAISPADGEDSNSPTMLLLRIAVLQFMVRSTLMGNVGSDRAQDESAVKSAAFYDDLLMEKFFSGLQEFMFYCPRSQHIAKHALQDSIVDLVVKFTHLETLAPEGERRNTKSVPPTLAVFAAVSCLFVKGMVASIASILIRSLEHEQCAPSSSRRSENGLLWFLVGLCAHVDLVPMDAVLRLFEQLLDMHNAIEVDRHTRVSAVFCIVYIAAHRTDALSAFRRQHGGVSETSPRESETSSYLDLLDFQDRFCGEIESREFYAMPLAWMALLWKEWFSFSEDDIASFVMEYEDHHHLGEEASFRRLQDSISFRNVQGVYVRQLKLLGSHYIASGHIDKVVFASGILESQKRALLCIGTPSDRAIKRSKRNAVRADPEMEERKLNVLMLPEVMERVCSFMSAKRLCRLAVVCKVFAEISRRERLWQQLCISLASREIAPVVCNHGDKYAHNWVMMYRKRWDARRRLRKKQRALASSRQRAQVEDPDSVDQEEESMRPPFAPLLCSFCDCYQLLSSQTQVDDHVKLHTQFQCGDRASCGASFTSLSQLKRHIKDSHPGEASGAARYARPEKARVPCGFEGCTKAYTSLKRLESHRKLQHPCHHADVEDGHHKKARLRWSERISSFSNTVEEFASRCSSRVHSLCEEKRMDRVIADNVPTADVLWIAAERIGKSSNGEEIQKICDYLVNKHWFQTAGDLRVAQSATEEWHSLQVPSRLKIAVQQVLEEVQYHQQTGNVFGYGHYYTADGSGLSQDEIQASASICPSDPSAANYRDYHYPQDASSEGSGYVYQYTAAEGASNGGAFENGYEGNAYSDDGYDYHQGAAYATESEVVEGHVVEEASTYEEILAPIRQEWSCRQCTYLNPVTESFCEMCSDHISASPDMVAIAMDPEMASDVTQANNPSGSNGSEISSESPLPAPSSTDAYAPHLQQQREGFILTLPCPTPPLSPLYSPSAPSMDEDDIVSPPLPAPIHRSLPSDVAMQLAFHGASSGTATIHPSKVTPPQEHFLALAFKSKSPAASSGVSCAVEKDQVRREEDALTEYSF